MHRWFGILAALTLAGCGGDSGEPPVIEVYPAKPIVNLSLPETLTVKDGRPLVRVEMEYADVFRSNNGGLYLQIVGDIVNDSVDTVAVEGVLLWVDVGNGRERMDAEYSLFPATVAPAMRAKWQLATVDFADTNTITYDLTLRIVKK